MKLIAVGDITCATLGVFEDTVIEVEDEDAFAITGALLWPVSGSYLGRGTYGLTSLRPRFSLPGLKIVTSNLPLYEDVHPFGGPSLGLMSSVTAWGTAKAVAARARRAREVRIVIRCDV